MSAEQPTVVCVCLTRNRPRLLKCAIRCFLAQTYQHKRMYILDSGTPAIESLPDGYPDLGITYHHTQADGRTIGTLRNYANSWALRSQDVDVIAHWDDDDLSHPKRLVEQVALLQVSLAECVGYSDMLFWRTADEQAWLYLGPQKALGTSLCYWRRTWEQKPFPDQPRPGFANGEDGTWIKGLELCAVSSFASLMNPRMIAAIHGANTSGSYKLIGPNSDSWRRVPEWDEYCSLVMSMNEASEQLGGDPTGEAGGDQIHP